MKRNRQVFGCLSKGLAVVLLGAFVVWLCILIETRPSMVFRRTIQNPVPESVRVLHARCDSAFDEVCWLHFLASPADLQQILSRKGFHPGTVDIATSSAPAWWKTNGTPYQASGPMCMYVSEDMTEAYAVILLD